MVLSLSRKAWIWWKVMVFLDSLPHIAHKYVLQVLNKFGPQTNQYNVFVLFKDFDGKVCLFKIAGNPTLWFWTEQPRKQKNWNLTLIFIWTTQNRFRLEIENVHTNLSLSYMVTWEGLWWILLNWMVGGDGLVTG